LQKDLSTLDVNLSLKRKIKIMKRSSVILLGLVGIVAILFIWVWSSYNGLVDKSANVDEQWAQIQADYQRRADLIPNLVKTVKGGAKNEREILENVTAARSGISSAKTPAQLDAAGAQINRAINIVVEAYPQIKGTELFGKLMNDIEGTENRIKESRKDYNTSVKTYNASIRKFPGNLIANMFDFEKRDFFAASSGSENAPQVDFE
jgi:LemA protein